MGLGRRGISWLGVALFAGVLSPLQSPASETVPVDPPLGSCGSNTIADSSQLPAGTKPAFPDAVRLPNGKLLVAFRVASDHNSYDGDIWLATGSLCDGEANRWIWSAPRKEVEDTGGVWDFRDPSLTVTKDGKLVIMSYFARRPRSGARPERRLEFKVSSNSGVNWSVGHPIRLETGDTSLDVADPVTSAKIIERSNGRLVLPFYGPRLSLGITQDHPRDVGMAETTWSGSRPSNVADWRWRDAVIAYSSGNPVLESYEEPAVAELKPGELRAVWRTSAATWPYGSRNAYEADSDTSSWGAARSLGVVMHAPEILPIPGTNKILYMWSQPDGTSRDVWARVSYLEKSFHDTCSKVVYDATGEAGYSGTVAIDSHSLYTVYYDLDLGQIRGWSSYVTAWESHPHYGCQVVGGTCVPPPPPPVFVPPC